MYVKLIHKWAHELKNSTKCEIVKHLLDKQWKNEMENNDRDMKNPVEFDRMENQ